MSRILITTDYLEPGDPVDEYLKGQGHEVVHAPLRGRRQPDELIKLLQDIDGALIANEPMSAEVLAEAPTLAAIVRTGVGYDSVDVEAASRLGILVSNLPGINANAVAEFAIGAMLSSARHFVDLAIGVSCGDWPRTDGHELRGATLGVIGFGASARALIPVAQAFGMTVLCTTNMAETTRSAASGVEFVDLDTLLSRSDYVSIHTALTPRTRHLIDERALSLMKPTAVLVNTARGQIVDEQALVTAVTGGTIAGAALDVTEVEPLPADSVLRDVAGITVFSHMAGQTAEARDAAGREGAIELVDALAGRPKFAVNRDMAGAPRVASR